MISPKATVACAILISYPPKSGYSAIASKETLIVLFAVNPESVVAVTLTIPAVVALAVNKPFSLIVATLGLLTLQVTVPNSASAG